MLFTVVVAVIVAIIKRHTPIGDRTEGQQRPQDRQLTKGKMDHSKTRENDNKLLPKPSKLICYSYSDHHYFLSFFSLTCSILLVISVVDFNMVSTQKKTTDKKLLSQLSESDTDFMTEDNSHETQPGNEAKRVDENTTLNNANISIKFNS